MNTTEGGAALTPSDDFSPLGREALSFLLRFQNRGFASARTSLELAQWVAHQRHAPSGVVTQVLRKLSDQLAPSEYTPEEVHFIKSVRRYGDAKDKISNMRFAYISSAHEWSKENSILIRQGFLQAINDHLRKQINAVARLTDKELQQIRMTISSYSENVARNFSFELSQSHDITIEDNAEAIIDTLLARVIPALVPNTLHFTISAQSRHQLTLSTPAIVATLLPDKTVLLPLAKQLLEVRDVEAQLSKLEQDAEAAFEALQASVAKARWNSAAPQN